jgi:hypothetical protein
MPANVATLRAKGRAVRIPPNAPQLTVTRTAPEPTVEVFRVPFRVAIWGNRRVPREVA